MAGQLRLIPPITDHVCAEIEYQVADGLVHGDICATGDKSKFMKCPEWRTALHRALDEWLNNSNGTGHFFVGTIEEEDEDEEDQ